MVYSQASGKYQNPTKQCKLRLIPINSSQKGSIPAATSAVHSKGMESSGPRTELPEFQTWLYFLLAVPFGAGSNSLYLKCKLTVTPSLTKR